MNTAILQTARQTTTGHASRHPDFHLLLGDAAWQRLPAAVRARFGCPALTGAVTIYRGRAQVAASLAGRVLAQLCRLIGTPVAPFVGDEVPVIVRVIDTPEGVIWERRYEFVGHAPVIVRSTKQLDEEGMLVEVLNAGLHMRLRVFEERGELHFLSTGYVFRIGPLRFRLPGWFLPGATHVVHQDLGEGRFRFRMTTTHHWFGRMFSQDGVFH